MTICIAILASDGLVIAADAQESDTYYKRPQQKILPYMGAIQLGGNPKPPSMACALTGAGDAGYLDAFFAFALRGIEANATQIDFENFLASKILTFHSQHLFHLALASDPPRIEVLIGAYVGHQTCMFVSHGSSLRRAFPYAAVGVGAHFAMSLVENFSSGRDVKHTEILAAYIIAITKERIEGCGNYTAIFSLHNSTIKDTLGEPSCLVAPSQPLTNVPGKKIRKWEESFGTRWAPRQTSLIEEMIEEELSDEAK